MPKTSRGFVSVSVALALLVAPVSASAAPEAEAPEAEAPEAEAPAAPEAEAPEAEGSEAAAAADPGAPPAEVEPAPASESAEAKPDPVAEEVPPLPDVEDEPEAIEVDEPVPEPAPEIEPLPVEPVDDDLDRDDGMMIDDGYDFLSDSSEATSARRWLGAGIAATVTGAALVGGAIALSQTAPCEPSAGNNCFPDARDRGAVTMGVPGGVLLLGGIAMTVVGALQKRRIKASLALAPGDLGVVVGGRF